MQTLGPHLLRHTAARAGRGDADPESVPRLVAELLEVATNGGRHPPPPGVENALVWSRAIASQDRATLVNIAEGYRNGGVLLLSADAYGDAALATDNESDRARSRQQRDSLLGRMRSEVGRVPMARDLPAEVAALLTRAERGVAAAVATGSSNKEVAARLVCSVRTVETHLTNIYRKLGIDGRTRLTAFLLDHHAA